MHSNLATVLVAISCSLAVNANSNIIGGYSNPTQNNDPRTIPTTTSSSIDETCMMLDELYLDDWPEFKNFVSSNPSNLINCVGPTHLTLPNNTVVKGRCYEYQSENACYQSNSEWGCKWIPRGTCANGVRGLPIEYVQQTTNQHIISKSNDGHSEDTSFNYNSYDFISDAGAKTGSCNSMNKPVAFIKGIPSLWNVSQAPGTPTYDAIKTTHPDYSSRYGSFITTLDISAFMSNAAETSTAKKTGLDCKGIDDTMCTYDLIQNTMSVNANSHKITPILPTVTTELDGGIVRNDTFVIQRRMRDVGYGNSPISQACCFNKNMQESGAHSYKMFAVFCASDYSSAQEAQTACTSQTSVTTRYWLNAVVLKTIKNSVSDSTYITFDTSTSGDLEGNLRSRPIPADGLNVMIPSASSFWYESIIADNAKSTCVINQGSSQMTNDCEVLSVTLNGRLPTSLFVGVSSVEALGYRDPSKTFADSPVVSNIGAQSCLRPTPTTQTSVSDCYSPNVPGCVSIHYHLYETSVRANITRITGTNGHNTLVTSSGLQVEQPLQLSQNLHPITMELNWDSNLILQLTSSTQQNLMSAYYQMASEGYPLSQNVHIAPITGGSNADLASPPYRFQDSQDANALIAGSSDGYVKVIKTFNIQLEMKTVNGIPLPRGFSYLKSTTNPNDQPAITVGYNSECTMRAVMKADKYRSTYAEYSAGYNTFKKSGPESESYSKVTNVLQAGTSGDIVFTTTVQYRVDVMVNGQCSNTGTSRIYQQMFSGTLTSGNDVASNAQTSVFGLTEFQYTFIPTPPGTNYNTLNQKVLQDLPIFGTNSLDSSLIGSVMTGSVYKVINPTVSQLRVTDTLSYRMSPLMYSGIKINAGKESVSETSYTYYTSELAKLKPSNLGVNGHELFDFNIKPISDLKQSGGEYFFWSVYAMDSGLGDISTAKKFTFDPMYLVMCTSANTANTESTEGYDAGEEFTTSSGNSAQASHCAGKVQSGTATGMILMSGLDDNNVPYAKTAYPNWYIENSNGIKPDIVDGTKHYDATHTHITGEQAAISAFDDLIYYPNTYGDASSHYFYTYDTGTSYGTANGSSQESIGSMVKLFGRSMKRLLYNGKWVGAEGGFVVKMPSFGSGKYKATFEGAFKVSYTSTDGARRSTVVYGNSRDLLSESGDSSEHAAIASSTVNMEVPNTLTRRSTDAAWVYHCPTNHSLTFTGNDQATENLARCVLHTQELAQATNTDVSGIAATVDRAEERMNEINEHIISVQGSQKDTSDELDTAMVILLIIVAALFIMGICVLVVLYLQTATHNSVWKLGTMLSRPSQQTVEMTNVKDQVVAGPSTGSRAGNIVRSMTGRNLI